MKFSLGRYLRFKPSLHSRVHALLCTFMCVCKALPLFYDLLTRTANNTVNPTANNTVDPSLNSSIAVVRQRRVLSPEAYPYILPAPEVVLQPSGIDAMPSIFFRLGHLPKQSGMFQLVWVRNPVDPSQTTCLNVLHDAGLTVIPRNRPKPNNTECDERGWPLEDSIGNKTCMHPVPCARFDNGTTFPVSPLLLSDPDATSGRDWANEVPSGSQDEHYLLFSTLCWETEGVVQCDWAAASAATLIQVSAVGEVSVLPLQEEMVQLSPNGCIHYNRLVLDHCGLY